MRLMQIIALTIPTLVVNNLNTNQRKNFRAKKNKSNQCLNYYIYQKIILNILNPHINGGYTTFGAGECSTLTCSL